MLSELPLSIIHIILALVPFRDAVRTCILSRQWRYIWATLSHLVFEYECASSDFTIIRKFEERMENFITNALLHRKGPIHKFEIYVPFRMCDPDVNEWILCLSRNDVRELILHMGKGFYCTWEQVVRSSIYSCEKLTNLKLAFCKLDPPPLTFKGFLFLKCLCLQEVDLSTDGIECLVANSPLLERLDLLGSRIAYGNEELRISSPNLKYLCVSGFYSKLCVSAPLLAEMSIKCFDCYDHIDCYRWESSVCNYTNLMSGFTNLEKLSGSDFFIKYLSLGIESCHHTLVFHHLKDIELGNVDFGDIRVVSVVVRLIVGAPNLHKLKIDICERKAQHLSFRDFGCAPNFTFEKLRVVEMSRVKGLPHEMDFVKFLLESSPVLETMKLAYIRKKQKWAAELLGFSRASPNAKLLFRLMTLA